MDQTQLRPSLGLGRMYAPGVRSGNGRTATRYSSKGGRDDRSRHRVCKQHQHTQSGIIGQVQESVKTILDIHSRNNNWLGLAKRRKKKVRSKSLERPGRAGHRRKQGGTVGNCDRSGSRAATCSASCTGRTTEFLCYRDGGARSVPADGLGNPSKIQYRGRRTGRGSEAEGETAAPEGTVGSGAGALDGAAKGIGSEGKGASEGNDLWNSNYCMLPLSQIALIGQDGTLRRQGLQRSLFLLPGKEGQRSCFSQHHATPPWTVHWSGVH